jgi:site-specific DNA-methyltransferase (adenine-specific)
VHYCKILLDQIFGRESFLNEIIWAYDYGARTRKKWPAKHDNILWYARDPDNYIYNVDAIERIPYMAPGLVGPEKAARGKLPTDTWWHTIVPTNGKEKTGYPTQSPGHFAAIVKVSSPEVGASWTLRRQRSDRGCLSGVGAAIRAGGRSLQAMEVMAGGSQACRH